LISLKTFCCSAWLSCTVTSTTTCRESKSIWTLMPLTDCRPLLMVLDRRSRSKWTIRRDNYNRNRVQAIILFDLKQTQLVHYYQFLLCLFVIKYLLIK
jgi:hypothetical protein